MLFLSHANKGVRADQVVKRLRECFRCGCRRVLHADCFLCRARPLRLKRLSKSEPVRLFLYSAQRPVKRDLQALQRVGRFALSDIERNDQIVRSQHWIDVKPHTHFALFAEYVVLDRRRLIAGTAHDHAIVQHRVPLRHRIIKATAKPALYRAD